MTWLIVTTIAVVSVGALFVVVPTALGTYLRFRGSRVVRCPEAVELAEVRLDARLAALTSAVGKQTLRLSSCSLWPAYDGCARKCIQFLE